MKEKTVKTINLCLALYLRTSRKSESKVWTEVKIILAAFVPLVLRLVFAMVKYAS